MSVMPLSSNLVAMYKHLVAKGSWDLLLAVRPKQGHAEAVCTNRASLCPPQVPTVAMVATSIILPNSPAFLNSTTYIVFPAKGVGALVQAVPLIALLCLGRCCCCFLLQLPSSTRLSSFQIWVPICRLQLDRARLHEGAQVVQWQKKHQPPEYPCLLP